jgi:imidazolonepropionase
MRSKLINIKNLINCRETSQILRGAELSKLPVINNAFLLIEDGIIVSYGSMQNDTTNEAGVDEVIDVSGQMVLPCWCDSHTHLVFAASREDEFVDKIKGLSYAEIAAKGGGILNSAEKIYNTDEATLLKKALNHLHELMQLGTGAIEIKSGYGLSVEGELKMLRVIKHLKSLSPIPIKATFLGAHAYPTAYKENHQQYIDSIINEMLPVIEKEGLADYIDVFCETGFFSPEETVQICEAGIRHGLKPKLHVNQLYSIGGIEAGIKVNALSLDHLETLTENDILLLGGATNWKGISTLLPTAAFFLRMPFQPARQLIDAGCAVALASDFNPGSSPSGNMNLVVAMSCIQMKMLPEEAINAATINGAFAMELQEEVGSITVGKKANIIITKPIPSIAFLPYAFGSNLIDKVMIGGEWL